MLHFNSGDPLANGADPGQLLVLGAAALVILALGLGVFNRRDLRGWARIGYTVRPSYILRT